MKPGPLWSETGWGPAGVLRYDVTLPGFGCAAMIDRVGRGQPWRYKVSGDTEWRGSFDTPGAAAISAEHFLMCAIMSARRMLKDKPTRRDSIPVLTADGQQSAIESEDPMAMRKATGRKSSAKRASKKPAKKAKVAKRAKKAKKTAKRAKVAKPRKTAKRAKKATRKKASAKVIGVRRGGRRTAANSVMPM